MDLTTFIIEVFCITHDWLKDKRLRQRGPRPALHDSEVLTMEIVGEFLGYDEEEAIYDYFRRHWAALFPTLPLLHRTTFARQAANLWRAKEQLWQDVLKRTHFDEQVSIVDSFPQPVCRFARSKWTRLFRDEAAYGYDELAKQTFYGFRFHARVCWPGVIVAAELTPANVHDLHVLEDLLDGATGWVLGDRNYWSPEKRAALAPQGMRLETPYKSKKRERQRWPLWLVQKRRRIETVFSQLVGRYAAKTVWARDMWHLCSRWLRKILSHTVAVFLAQQAGLPSPLQFDLLLDA
jgi:hypothetical protein